MLVFLAYNLFTKTLFFRTLYPFFTVALLYSALGVVQLYRRRRAAAALLLALMAARGCLFLSLYLPDHRAPQLISALESARKLAPEGRLIWLFPNASITGGREALTPYLDDALCLGAEALDQNAPLRLQGGDVVVTGSFDYWKGSPYILPISHQPSQQLIDGWTRFKRENAPYLVWRSYPEWYVPAFGLWVKGSNVCFYDFPINYVYCLP